MTTTGTLILLNGTSSSGKSTILNEFQKTHSHFRFFKIDDWFSDAMASRAKELGWRQENSEHPWLFLTQFVEEQTGRPHFDSEIRAYLFQEVSLMYREAKKALESGSTVVIDTVFEYNPEYQTFSDFFEGFAVIKALVYCRLDVLLDRVHTRNKSGTPAEMRTAFLSFEQFPAIYKLQTHQDELVIDTISSELMKTALTTAIQDLIANGIPEKFLTKLDHFRANFIKAFELDKRKEIELVARHPYDIVLDSSSNTPEELAQLIGQALAHTR